MLRSRLETFCSCHFACSVDPLIGICYNRGDEPCLTCCPTCHRLFCCVGCVSHDDLQDRGITHSCHFSGLCLSSIMPRGCLHSVFLASFVCRRLRRASYSHQVVNRTNYTLLFSHFLVKLYVASVLSIGKCHCRQKSPVPYNSANIVRRCSSLNL